MVRDCLRRAYRSVIPFIYAQTNYKLFLKKSFIELDSSIQSLMCATDAFSGIVKPIPIKPPFGSSMLVIAPHQDDETIGCGGAMLLQKRCGENVQIVFVYDGGDEHKEYGLSRKEVVSIREGEALRVSQEIGVESPKFLRHGRSSYEEIKIIAEGLKEEILKSNADCIFAPFFLDHNIEHRMVALALAEALSGIHEGRKVYGYEVWGLCVPNVILIVDNVMKDKQKLLSLYKSQQNGTDYLNSVTGLNMYHSRAFGSGVCKYAERFFEMPAKDYIEVVRKLRPFYAKQG